MPSLELFQATTDDLPFLAKMNFALIGDEGHRNAMQPAELLERMRGWLDTDYTAMIFRLEGVDVGYALWRREDEVAVYLRQFYIAREFRRRGLGTQAIRWLRDNCWRDASRIRLDVLVNNQSGIDFWRALGFKDYCLTMELESGSKS